MNRICILIGLLAAAQGVNLDVSETDADLKESSGGGFPAKTTSAQAGGGPYVYKLRESGKCSDDPGFVATEDETLCRELVKGLVTNGSLHAKMNAMKVSTVKHFQVRGCIVNPLGNAILVNTKGTQNCGFGGIKCLCVKKCGDCANANYATTRSGKHFAYALFGGEKARCGDFSSTHTMAGYERIETEGQCQAAMEDMISDNGGTGAMDWWAGKSGKAKIDAQPVSVSKKYKVRGCMPPAHKDDTAHFITKGYSDCRNNMCLCRKDCTGCPAPQASKLTLRQVKKGDADAADAGRKQLDDTIRQIDAVEDLINRERKAVKAKEKAVNEVLSREDDVKAIAERDHEGHQAEDAKAVADWKKELENAEMEMGSAQAALDAEKAKLTKLINAAASQSDWGKAAENFFSGNIITGFVDSIDGLLKGYTGKKADFDMVGVAMKKVLIDYEAARPSFEEGRVEMEKWTSKTTKTIVDYVNLNTKYASNLADLLVAFLVHHGEDQYKKSIAQVEALMGQWDKNKFKPLEATWPKGDAKAAE